MHLKLNILKLGLVILSVLSSTVSVFAARGDIYYSDLKDENFIFEGEVINRFMGGGYIGDRNVGDLHASHVIRSFYFAELDLEDSDIAFLSIKAVNRDGRIETLQKFTGIQMRNGRSFTIIWNKREIIKNVKFPESNVTSLGYDRSTNSINYNIDLKITESFQYENDYLVSTGHKAVPTNSKWLSSRKYSKKNPVLIDMAISTSRTSYKDYSLGDEISINRKKGTIWKISSDKKPVVFAYTKGSMHNYSSRAYCTSSTNAPEGWRIATKQELLEIAFYKKSRNELDFNTYCGPDYAVNMVLMREVEFADPYYWTDDWYWVTEINTNGSFHDNFNKNKTSKKNDQKNSLEPVRHFVKATSSCRSCRKYTKEIERYYITLDNALRTSVIVEVKSAKRGDKINYKFSRCIMRFMLRDILELSSTYLYRNLPVKNAKGARRLIRKNQDQLISEIFNTIGEVESKTHDGKYIIITYNNTIYQSDISQVLYDFMESNYGYNGTIQDVEFAVGHGFTLSDSEKGYIKAQEWLNRN